MQTPRRVATTATPLAPGAASVSGYSRVLISCTAAGTVALNLASGSMTITVPVGVTSIDNVDVQGVSAGTATATVYGLR